MSATPPTHAPRTGSVLRWLTAGAAVAGLHLLALWSGWNETGDGLAESALPPGALHVPVAVLAPPAQAPAPPALRAAPGPSPAAKVAPAPPAKAPGEPAPEPQATPASPGHDAAPTAAAPPGAASDSLPAHEPTPAPRQLAPEALVLPPPMRLTYLVEGQTRGLGYRADATLDWRQDGQHYEARMEISAFLVGSRSQSSTGRLDAEGLQPERFVDRARRLRVTVFDREAGRLRQEDGGAGPALAAGTQDKLSVFLQLAARLAALPHAPASGTALSLPVAASSAIETWQFRFEGAEALALPAGSVPSWKFSRPPLHAGEAGLELWVAPGLAFLPVRIRLQQDNGDSVDQRLSRH